MSNRRDARDKVRHGWSGALSVASVARVSHNDESPDAAMRQRVLDAALAELATTNAGSFTIAAVAQRAGLEVQVVKDMWANTPELISAALMAYAGRTMPVPDTGSLCEDLVGYAKGFAAAVNSPTGRRLLDAVVATPKDWDVSGWRSAFFQAHRRLVQSSAVPRPAHYRRGLRSRGGPSIERHSHESLRPGELHCAPACSAFGSVTRHGSAAAPLGVTRPGPCQ